MTCPESGVEFDENERVLQVEYYERVGKEATTFRPEQGLGVCIIPESMLRAGGKEFPVSLEERRATRYVGALMLSDALNARILNLIDHVYKDDEYE